MSDLLLNAIETSLFYLPELPGKIDWLRLPGLIGHVSVASDFFTSSVGASTLEAEAINPTIAHLDKLFNGREWGWVVGPKSTPGDLRTRLETAGLENWVEMAGMALTDLKVPIENNPVVSVREMAPVDLETASHLLAQALNISEEGARLATEALLFSQMPIQRRVYLAYLAGVDGPVGYASLIHLPGQPIVVLWCAATLEQHRRKGVYQSLVARRLADAYRDGARAAVIQAVRDTSAPICRKLGFVELCGLDWYIRSGVP